MVSARNLFSGLRAARRSTRFRDFQRVIEAFGFRLERITGSHHIYWHPVVREPLNIQSVGNMAKSYQIDQFLATVRDNGLEMDS